MVHEQGWRSHQAIACCSHVVSCKTFQLSAYSSPPQAFEEYLDLRQFQVIVADNQVVAFCSERDEIQSENTRRCSGADATVRVSALHLPGGGQVAECYAVVSLHVFSGDAETVQERIQQVAASRPRFAVDDLEIGPNEISDTMDTLRIAGADYYPLFPQGEPDNGDRRTEHAADFGQVRFAGLFIHKMGARNVNDALLEKLERTRAVPIGYNQFYAFASQILCQNSRGRVAARDEQPISFFPVFFKNSSLDSFYPRPIVNGAQRNGISLGQTASTGFGRSGHESAIHGAQLQSLPRLCIVCS